MWLNSLYMFHYFFSAEIQNTWSCAEEVKIITLCSYKEIATLQLLLHICDSWLTKKSLVLSVSMQAIPKNTCFNLKKHFFNSQIFTYSKIQVSLGYIDCMWSSTLKDNLQIIVSMYVHIFCSSEDTWRCVPPGFLGHLNFFNLSHVRLVLLWGHKHKHYVAPQDVLMLLEAFFFIESTSDL